MPVEIQERIQIRFGNHPPLTHPFPNDIETIFDYFIDNEQNNGTDLPPVDTEGVNLMQDSDIFQEQSQAEDTPFVAAPISEINEIEDLQHSLRTFRLSNEGLSLLLDRNRVELAKKATIVARLEQGI